MANPNPEKILDNIENLLDTMTESKLRLASEEKIPLAEEVSKTSGLIKDNPAGLKESLRDLLKHSLTVNQPKNEHLQALKKLIQEILAEISDEKTLAFYFDDFFFDKFELLTERREVFQYIEIVEICLCLVCNEKVLLGICQLNETRRIFTIVLNYLLGVNEQLNFNILGVAVKNSLKSLLEFLRKNSNFIRGIFW